MSNDRPFLQTVFNGRPYEYLKRPDGSWGWRFADTKEWCAPIASKEDTE